MWYEASQLILFFVAYPHRHKNWMSLIMFVCPSWSWIFPLSNVALRWYTIPGMIRNALAWLASILRHFSLTFTTPTSVVKLANVNPYGEKVCLLVPPLLLREPDIYCRYLVLAQTLEGFLLYSVHSSQVTNLEKPRAVSSFLPAVALVYFSLIILSW